jgi:hypothetical protein
LWGSAPTISALFGLPRGRLLTLAKQGHIRARKLDPAKRTSATVYKVGDVKDWLENEAPSPRAEPFEARRRAAGAGVAQG